MSSEFKSASVSTESPNPPHKSELRDLMEDPRAAENPLRLLKYAAALGPSSAARSV
jgi:hypothetical protein